jgi:hypothetical protein
VNVEVKCIMKIVPRGLWSMVSAALTQVKLGNILVLVTTNQDIPTTAIKRFDKTTSEGNANNSAVRDRLCLEG